MNSQQQTTTTRNNNHQQLLSLPLNLELVHSPQHLMDEIYVASFGEIVILTDPPSCGIIGVVQGIWKSRVSLRLFHNGAVVNIKQDNFLEWTQDNSDDDEEEDESDIEDFDDEGLASEQMDTFQSTENAMERIEGWMQRVEEEVMKGDAGQSQGLFNAELHSATVAKNTGDYSGCMSILMQALDKDANNPKILSRIASEYVDLSDVDTALPFINRAIESTGGRWAFPRSLLACVYNIQGDHSRAIEELTRVVLGCKIIHPCEESHEAVDTYLKAANLLQNLGADVNIILHSYLKALNVPAKGADSSSKARARGYFDLGIFLEQQFEQTNCLQQSYLLGSVGSNKKACEMDDQEPSYKIAASRSLRRLSALQRNVKGLDESILLLTNAASALPHVGILHAELGYALTQKQCKQEAVVAFARAVELSTPGDPWLPDVQAMIAQLSGSLLPLPLPPTPPLPSSTISTSSLSPTAGQFVPKGFAHPSL